MSSNEMKEGYAELKKELASEMKKMKELKEHIAEIKMMLKHTKTKLDKRKPVKLKKKAFFEIGDKVYVDEIGKTKDKKYKKLPNKLVYDGKWKAHLDSPRAYYIVVRIPPVKAEYYSDNNPTPNRKWF